MPSAINTLPPNVPIGTTQDAAGNTLMVMATPEFVRAQVAMLERIGGTVGMSSDDLAALCETEAGPALVLALRAEVAVLRAELEIQALALAHVPRLAHVEAIRRELALIEDPAAIVRFILTRFASLNSPKFTGTPTAPTAPVDTNTDQLATTKFVLGQAATDNPVADGVAAPGASTRYARADHVHPTDSTRQAKITPATVTGSRGGNAALASLLSGLATEGLINDTTTP